MDIWKVIEGTEGRYEVSNTGKIRSLNYLGHGTTKELALTRDEKGYLRVRIYVDGVRKTVRVHRVVAETFIPNPYEKPEVNHKDGNKENNCDWNLEWTTERENTLHAYRSGLKEKTREHCRKMGLSVGKEILRKSREARKTPVIAIRLEDGAVFEYNSQAEASEKTGALQPNINKVLSGDRKSANGFVFRYKEVV